MPEDPAWQPGDTLRCTADSPPLAAGQPCRLLALDSATATVEAAGRTILCPAALLRLSIPAHPAPGRYRHYRGGLYTLLCVARHSETEEWLVTYTSDQTGDHWVRPLAMWCETVDGRPRFEEAGMGSAQTRKGPEAL
ncbi:MAG: DUF1653 domain-containing protein [Janthinobacterium lividum]